MKKIIHIKKYSIKHSIIFSIKRHCFYNDYLFNNMNKNFSSKIITATGVFHVNTNTQYMFGRSQTSLIKNVPYLNTLSRSYPGRPIVNAALALEQRRFLTNKAVLYFYSEHFKKYSLNQLLDDRIIINIMHNFISENPILHSRALQLAFEVTYNKRMFKQKTLELYYSKNFLILDSLNMNSGLCDQSEVFNATVTDALCKYFNYDINNVILNIAPSNITLEQIQQLPESIKKQLEHNKKMTGNTFNDLDIKGRPYDHKEVKHMSFNKNHVTFIDSEQFKETGDRILFAFETSLIGTMKDPMTTIAVKEYTRSLLKLMQDQRQLSTPAQVGLENINAFLNKSDLPQDFKCPLLVVKKKASLDDLNISDDIKNVVLDKGSLDSVKSRKAIIGLLNTWDKTLLRDITQATNNSLIFPHIAEEVD